MRADAQAVGEELELLSNVTGTLTPVLVVQRAANANSSLHGLFEWDDTEAARRYREDQARYILRQITVRVEYKHDEPRQLRAFVVVTRDEKRTYVPLMVVMGDAELRHQVLEHAYDEMRLWVARYREYEELAGFVGAVTEVLPLLAEQALVAVTA